MAQNDTLLAIGAELAASLNELSAGQATILADIQAANTAGTPIPDSTIAALQSSADGIKAVADSITAALNPAPGETPPTS